MKLFLNRTLLFTIILVLGCMLLITFLPYNKKYGYNSVPGFNKKILSWIYDRIFINPDNIDIAFIGTSHTLEGIADSLVEERLSTMYKNNSIKVANLGISHMGRNSHFVLSNDLLLNKKPKLVIIEVRERESPFGHIAFSFIAKGKDIVFPKSLLNLNIIRDYSYAIRNRLNFFSESIFQRFENTNLDLSNGSKFGFKVSQEEISYDEIVKRKEIYENNHLILEKKIISDLVFHLNRTYLESLSYNISNATKLVFLYLPHYNSRHRLPFDIKLYSKYGDVWIPPDSITNNYNNFANLTHFNKIGAIKCSEWVSSKIYENLNK